MWRLIWVCTVCLWPFNGFPGKNGWSDMFCICLKPAHSTLGINESANLRFLQRLCVFLASSETVRDLLLPAETTVHEKWLPAETVRVILLPVETIGRKLKQTDSLCRKLFTKHNSLDRTSEITDSLSGSQIWRAVSEGSAGPGSAVGRAPDS